MVYAVDAEIDAEGVSSTMTPVRAYVAEGISPEDAVLAWAAQVEIEEQS